MHIFKGNDLTTTPMKLLSLLVVLSTVLHSYSQEDFRLRPWSECNGYSKQNQIVISEEGKVISFPQHIYEGASDQTTEICLVDSKGKRLNYEKFKTRDIDALAKGFESLLSLKNTLKVGDSLYSKREAFVDFFKEEGLAFDNYLLAVKKISTGKKLDSKNPYAKYFPKDLHEVFSKKESYHRKLQIIIQKKQLTKDQCLCDTKKLTPFIPDTIDISECGDGINTAKLASGEYTFKLELNKPVSKLVFNQLKDFKNEYEDLEIKKKQEEMDSLIQVLQTYISAIDEIETNGKTICSDEFDRITKSITRTESIDYQGTIGFLSKWKLNWIWFSNHLSIDPFLGDLKLSKHTKQDLVDITNELKAHELLLSSGSVTFTRSSNIETVSAEYVDLVNKKTGIEKAIKKEAKFLKEHQASFNASAEKTVIYEGAFFVSDKNNRYVMRNHDASNEYKLMDEQREAYYDYESVKYLTHNVTDAKKVVLVTTGTAITSHSPSWVSDVTSIFDGLDAAYTNTKVPAYFTPRAVANPDVNLNNAPQLAASPGDTVEKPSVCGDLEELDWGSHSQKLKDIKIKCNALIASLGKSLDAAEELHKSKELDWIKRLTKLKTPKPILGATKELVSNRKYKNPATVSYEITKYKNKKEVESKHPFAGSFSHYKRKYVQLYAGVNVSLTSVNKVVIDEEATSIDPIIESQPLQATAGLKIYPFGSVIEDNRFLAASRYRFHIVGGMSIPKPFDNLYVGLGYDIIPGLSMHCNVQFFKTKEYIISNGAVESSRNIYKPAINVGIGVDATLFVKAFNFITK